VGKDSQNLEAAKALLAFLTSPEAVAVYKARGMEPGK
jgi:ABC-type Fe3+ transport system substrate-binding protein